jgi:hypothetical protein
MSSRSDSRMRANRVSSGSQYPIISLRVRARTRGGGTNFRGERGEKDPCVSTETVFAPKWNVELETLAAELGYRTAKATEIQKEFANLVAAIASVRKPRSWSAPIGTRPINRRRPAGVAIQNNRFLGVPRACW